MCLAMNPDKLAPGERSASTSNRNFEGRQGRGGRTHLVSPAVAAATAIAGHFALPEDLQTLMQAVQIVQGTAVPLDRSDVDTDQIIPAEWLKRVERTGLRQGPVLVVAGRPQLRAQRRALRRREHPHRRPQLRHRLEPRARRVGDHGLRLPGRDQPPLRRHLPQQLHQERPRARAWCPPRSASSCWRPSRPTRRSSSWSTSTGARCPRPPSASRSTSRSRTAVRERFLEGLDDIGITLRTEEAITAFEAQPARLAPDRLEIGQRRGA